MELVLQCLEMELPISFVIADSNFTKVLVSLGSHLDWFSVFLHHTLEVPEGWIC